MHFGESGLLLLILLNIKQLVGQLDPTHRCCFSQLLLLLHTSSTLFPFRPQSLVSACALPDCYCHGLWCWLAQHSNHTICRTCGTWIPRLAPFINRGCPRPSRCSLLQARLIRFLEATIFLFFLAFDCVSYRTLYPPYLVSRIVSADTVDKRLSGNPGWIL